jgi:hypothetical protein
MMLGVSLLVDCLASRVWVPVLIHKQFGWIESNCTAPFRGMVGCGGLIVAGKKAFPVFISLAGLAVQIALVGLAARV